MGGLQGEYLLCPFNSSIIRSTLARNLDMSGFVPLPLSDSFFAEGTELDDLGLNYKTYDKVTLSLKQSFLIYKLVLICQSPRIFLSY